MATVSSVKEELYVCKETTWGTAVAPTNSNCVRFISASIIPNEGEIQRPDKNADEDEPAGQGGRRSCTGTVSMSMAGSGTAGTAPDCGPLLEAAFGKVATVSAGVSVTYGLGSLRQSLSIWKYCETGLAQCAIGAVITQMRVVLGNDAPTLEFSFEAKWGYDSAQAADGTTETAAKGGLGSWPAKPSSPTTNGNHPKGFDGVITLDGQTYDTYLTETITLATGRQLPKDGMNKYPTAPVTGTRTVGDDFGIKEDDSAKLIALIQKAMSKTAVDCTSQIGTVAGNRWAWTKKNMLLVAPNPDAGSIQRHIVFNGSRAHPTSSGSMDALALVIT